MILVLVGCNGYDQRQSADTGRLMMLSTTGDSIYYHLDRSKTRLHGDTADIVIAVSYARIQHIGDVAFDSGTDFYQVDCPQRGVRQVSMDYRMGEKVVRTYDMVSMGITHWIGLTPTMTRVYAAVCPLGSTAKTR